MQQPWGLRTENGAQWEQCPSTAGQTILIVGLGRRLLCDVVDVFSRRTAILTATAALVAPVDASAFEEPATVAYQPDGDVLLALPFGTHSHWLQPWRAATDT